MTTLERDYMQGLVEALGEDAAELRDWRAEGITEVVMDLTEQLQFCVALRVFLMNVCSEE